MRSLLIIIALTLGFSSCAQNNHSMNVTTFINNFENYNMDIQAAGIAGIPVATLSNDNVLYIEYHYNSGNEKRKGKMTLTLVSDNRFEGNWKTDADNGNSYDGALYFQFDGNGEASGYYKYGGSDYKITIFIRR